MTIVSWCWWDQRRRGWVVFFCFLAETHRRSLIDDFCLLYLFLKKTFRNESWSNWKWSTVALDCKECTCVTKHLFVGLIGCFFFFLLGSWVVFLNQKFSNRAQCPGAEAESTERGLVWAAGCGYRCLTGSFLTCFRQIALSQERPGYALLLFFWLY